MRSRALWRSHSFNQNAVVVWGVSGMTICEADEHIDTLFDIKKGGEGKKISHQTVDYDRDSDYEVENEEPAPRR